MLLPVGREALTFRAGLIESSGGLGTDFFVDPDGTVGVLLTQVEMGSQLWPLIADFQELPPLR